MEWNGVFGVNGILDKDMWLVCGRLGWVSVRLDF